MMAKGLSVQDKITQDLKAMVSRANAVSSFLNRNIFQMYQKAQIERFQTENASETGQWQSLNSKYLKRKKKKYASFPGGGNAVMIATGKLKDAATGRANFTKLVTNTSFTISIDLGSIPYAVYPGKMRPYMEFSDATENSWSQAITDFITKNKQVNV